ESVQAKHRFMVSALARSYRADDADRFLKAMETLVQSLERTLIDGATCRAVVVTKDEPVIVAESRRLLDALAERHVSVGAVVWNGTEPVAGFGIAANYRVPRLAEFPVGAEG